MELRLSEEEEECQLDHMVSEGEWRILGGQGYECGQTDSRIPKAATSTLRRGKAYMSFAMSAMGRGVQRP